MRDSCFEADFGTISVHPTKVTLSVIYLFPSEIHYIFRKIIWEHVYTQSVQFMSLNIFCILSFLYKTQKSIDKMRFETFVLSFYFGQ